MSDASGRYAQQIDSARQAAGRGDRPAAAEALRAAIETTRSHPDLAREHAAALVRLGALEREMGRSAEAERLLCEAVASIARNGSTEDPSLGLALNELSRLYIRQSDHLRALPVLERLLQLARAKGERHPDVATALAGLAVAKRGLGDDASAEQLFRHALRIREQTLAPDHMAIVVTLEQLADTCAARGNVGEGLVLFRRALLRRERALGVDHASVHALQGRIGDLERRAVASAGTRPDHPRELDFLYRPAPPATRPATPSPERAPLPAAAAASAPETSWLADVETRAPRTAAASAPPAFTDWRVASDAPAARPVAPALAESAAPAPNAPIELPAPTPMPMRRTLRYAAASAAVVVLAIAGFAFASPSSDEADQTPPLPSIEGRGASVVQASMSSAPVRVHDSSSERASGYRAESSAITIPGRSAAAGDAPAAAPSAPASLPNLRKLSVPKIAVPNVDAVMAPKRDADAELIAAGRSLTAPAPEEDAGITPPVLVSSPSLKFPDELRAQRVEGEVVVQFRVNEKGRVEPNTMQVLQSEHELFTAAVRAALPRFRFEPAHAGAPGSKPQAAWVQFRTRFATRS